MELGKWSFIKLVAIAFLISGFSLLSTEASFAKEPGARFLVNFNGKSSDSDRDIYEPSPEFLELSMVNFHDYCGSLMLTLNSIDGHKDVYERIVRFKSYTEAAAIKDYIEKSADQHEIYIGRWKNEDSGYNFDYLLFVNLQTQERISGYRVLLEAALKETNQEKPVSNIKLVFERKSYYNDYSSKMRNLRVRDTLLGQYDTQIVWKPNDQGRHPKAPYLQIVLSKEAMLSRSLDVAIGRNAIYVPAHELIGHTPSFSVDFLFDSLIKHFFGALIDPIGGSFLIPFFTSTEEKFSLVIEQWGAENCFGFRIRTIRDETGQKFGVREFVKMIKRDTELKTGVYKNKINQMKDWIAGRGKYQSGGSSSGSSSSSNPIISEMNEIKSEKLSFASSQGVENVKDAPSRMPREVPPSYSYGVISGVPYTEAVAEEPEQPLSGLDVSHRISTLEALPMPPSELPPAYTDSLQEDESEDEEAHDESNNLLDAS